MTNNDHSFAPDRPRPLASDLRPEGVITNGCLPSVARTSYPSDRRLLDLGDTSRGHHHVSPNVPRRCTSSRLGLSLSLFRKAFGAPTWTSCLSTNDQQGTPTRLMLSDHQRSCLPQGLLVFLRINRSARTMCSRLQPLVFTTEFPPGQTTPSTYGTPNRDNIAL